MTNPLRPARRPDECGHEWFVYLMALANRELLVECPHCGSMGVVENPTEEEWERAYSAPVDPYRWEDVGRVKNLGLT